MAKLRSISVWRASYEHGWGTRGERSFTHVNFDYKPTLKEACTELMNAGVRHCDPSYATYGPLTIRQHTIVILTR